ncbi:MAG: exodeoxyribonuclease VII large subunit, partial [Paracoccus sp. (in: a-proteobacteria)]
DRLGVRLDAARERRLERRRDRIAALAERLTASLGRTIATTRRSVADQTERLGKLSARLDTTMARMTATRWAALETLDRTRQTLGYTQTLKRGFAVVHGPEGLITSAENARQSGRFEVEFTDGRVPVRPDATPQKASRKRQPPQQKTLF